MWNDLNKVDFNNVQEQSSWVCQCDESLITKLEQDFKQTLAQQVSSEVFVLLYSLLALLTSTTFFILLLDGAFALSVYFTFKSSLNLASVLLDTKMSCFLKFIVKP